MIDNWEVQQIFPKPLVTFVLSQTYIKASTPDSSVPSSKTT
jgi:hypothetical protein